MSGAGKRGGTKMNSTARMTWASVVVAALAIGGSTSSGTLAADGVPEPDSLLSREEHLSQVLDGLTQEAGVSATEITAVEWAPGATPEGEPLPAELPEEDVVTIVLAGSRDAIESPAAEGAPREAGGELVGAATARASSFFAGDAGDPVVAGPEDVVSVGGMDVQVGPVDGATSPSAIELHVHSQESVLAEDVTGVRVSVTDLTQTPEEPEEPRSLRLTLSYEEFAGAAGADWASRLRLVRFPECPSGDADAAQCLPIPVTGSINDLVGQTVTAEVELTEIDSVGPDASGTSPARGGAAGEGATRMASAAMSAGGATFGLVAGASGAAGDWGATSLSPSSSWGTSGNTGAFTWSYPLTLPAVPAGGEPELSLSYSSAASDGRVPSANNQASWVGEGFELTSSYIERRYVPCGEDKKEVAGHKANNASIVTADLCWGQENATLALNGTSAELLKDATSGAWHAKNEDGSIIELKPQSEGGNEYWVVTTVDGTRHYFGRGKVPGVASGLESAWKVPVFGNHEGEPCYNSAYGKSRCAQVWRWNLDHVVDPLGNTTTYRYAADEAAYQMFRYDSKNDPWGEDVDKSVVEYNPGGYLRQIAYGTHQDAPAASAPALVDFTVETRCERGDGVDCAANQMHKSKKNKIAWPDVPTDLFCAPGSTACKGQSSPVFFDRYRLKTITTRTFDGSAYQPVDSWTLKHLFDAPNTYVTTGKSKGSGKILRLESLTHTGHAGTASNADDLTELPVLFGWKHLRNRVKDDGLPMWRPRLTSLRSESGATASINYKDPECTPENLPAKPSANSKLCYPVKWDPQGETESGPDWFHKYVVDSVIEQGASPARDGKTLVTGSGTMTTAYRYGGKPAWVKPTGALVKPKDVTYSEFRGFPSVTTVLGEGAERTASRESYFRGTGDTLTAGPGDHEVSVADDERLAGRVFTSEELLLPGGDPAKAKVVSLTVTKPGDVKTTATSKAGIKATYLARTEALGFTFDASGALVYRTATLTTLDKNSQVKRIEDRGQEGTSTDDVCTTVIYAHEADSGVAESVRTRLSGGNQVSLAARTTQRAGACSATGSEVLSDSLTDYNSDGLMTKSWELKADHDSSTSTLDPVSRTGYDLVESIASFDRWGRPTASTDALGRTTRTAYVHSAGGLLQEARVAAPNPADKTAASAFVSTTVHNPLTGDVIETRDANGRRTTGRYDALSRLIEVRYPDRQAAGLKPSVEYSYRVEATGLNAVVTKSIGADGTTQHVSSVLYDGLMRPFQEQSEGADAGAAHTDAAATRGRIITHTLYDTAGRVSRAMGAWWAKGSPGGVPVEPPATTPSRTTYVYDGAGRVTDEILWNGTDSNPDYEEHRTVTNYDGRYTTVVPPAGGTATTTVVDAHGRTTALWEHLARPTVAKGASGSSSTLLGFDAATLTSGYQATTYAYDRAGQMVTMKDPAGNSWTKAYDKAGRLVSSSDPDAGTTVTTYDKAGQVASVRNANGETLTYEYDFLGRTTRLSEGATTKAQWTYDTSKDPSGKTVLGPVASTTRVVDGQPYTTAVDTYDQMGRALAVRTVLPAVGDLARLANRSFTTTYAYTADGQLASTTYPQVTQQGSSGGALVLGQETVTTQYDTASKPHWSSGGFGWGVYVAESRHTARGQLLATDLGNTYGAVVSYAYDEVTERLTGISLKRERITGTDLALGYAYDDAGNVTSISDAPTNPSLAQGVERQCFSYDGLRRLTSAWAIGGTGACAAPGSVSAASLGGPAPFWSTYAYDKLGNRTQLVERGKVPAATRTTTYTHGQGTAGPHAVTTAATVVEGGTSTATSYTYDKAGNQITRKVGAGATTALDWDAQGQLAGVSIAGSASTLEPGEAGYVYDTAGNRMVRAQASGTTVYLPGGQEVFVPKAGNVSATRYYSFAGRTVAVRTGAGLGGVFSLVTDLHGTPVASVANTRWSATSVTRLRTDAFGAARGSSSSASIPGERQFLGKTRDDATGLTLLGARYYDEALGRFISVDPVLSPGVPAQFNAYVYSGNNPVTWADPTGLFWNPVKAVSNGWNAAKSAVSTGWNATKSFVSRNQSAIVGTIVGVAVFTGCTVATGGAGVVGCGAAAGASAGAVSNLWKTKVQKAAPFSWGGLARDTLSGAAGGAAGAGLGVVAGKVIPAAASKVGSALSTTVKRVTPKPAPVARPAASAARAAGSSAKAPPTAPVASASNNATDGMAGVRSAGVAGEQSAGIVKNTQRIPSLSGTASYRIPDELTSTALGEVKNVANLSYTNQLRDFAAYAQQEGLGFNLYVRGSTRLSGPLQDAVGAGQVNLLRNLP